MPKNFGERLKEVRKQHSLTQHQIAKYIGISQASYSKLERNQCKCPNVESVGKICQILKIDANYLFDVPRSENLNSQNMCKQRMTIQQLIEKLKLYYVITQKTSNERVQRRLWKLTFEEKDNTFHIQYKTLLSASFNKSDFSYSRLMLLSSIVLAFVSEMIDIIDKTATMELNPELCCWRIFYGEIVSYVFTDYE